MFFGWKRFCDDLAKVNWSDANVSEDYKIEAMWNCLSRFGRANFIAGGLITAAGAAIGIVTPRVVAGIKEKQKNKELKGTNK